MEFDLSGSNMEYCSGDALGIYPQNNPPEVDAVVSAMHCSGEEDISIPPFCYLPKPEGVTMTLRAALQKYYDLKTIRRDLVKVLVESVTDAVEREKGEILLNAVVCTYIIYHVLHVCD